jgi:hypothetical protein
MTVHTVPSRDFARDVGRAKRLTADGPVFITDRGRPAFALLKIEDYHRLTHTQPRSLLDAMDAIEGGAFDFEPPRIDGAHKALDLD